MTTTGAAVAGSRIFPVTLDATPGATLVAAATGAVVEDAAAVFSLSPGGLWEFFAFFLFLSMANSRLS